MNPDDLLQLIEKTEHERGDLSIAEKNLLRSQILARVNTQAVNHSRSPYASYLHIAMRISAAFILVLGIGMMGTTYASADALPGDFLYKFKVTVREPLIALTKNNDTDRGAYALERVEERYREIAMLAKHDALTKERGTEALTYLKAQTQEVATRAKAKPTSIDSESVTTYLATSRTASSTIAAHSKALATVTISNTDADAQSIIREAQEVASEGVQSIATSTHEVIESLPQKDVAVLAVNDLETKVAAVSDASTSAKVAVAMTAEPVMLSIATTAPVDAQSSDVVDTTVGDIELLMQKLESTIADISKQPTTSSDEADTITALYHQALEAKEAGDFTKALELLHKALSAYNTTQKTIEVENEINASKDQISSSSSSESSIISSTGSTSTASSSRTR